MKTEQRKDKREIGIYDDRLEKSCMFRNRVIKIILLFIFVENKEDHIKVKLRRAQGECLGTGSRRRTWLTAISLGEP